MPDFVPVSGSIEFKITVVSTATGKKMYNIGHTSCASPNPTQSQCQDTVDAVSAWVIATYKSFYTADLVCVEVRARSNAQEPGPIAINSAINQAGALADDRLAASDTLCVNTLSGTTGQRRRGKFYVFQATEAVRTNGLYTSAYCSSMETALASLATSLATVGQALAVESRRDLALYAIIGYSAQPIPSHLASRKANRGI